jgi:sulfur-oxidizing protein SoxZ
VTFYTMATESGTITFKWTGDHGFEQTESANIAVT